MVDAYVVVEIEVSAIHVVAPHAGTGVGRGPPWRIQLLCTPRR